MPPIGPDAGYDVAIQHPNRNPSILVIIEPVIGFRKAPAGKQFACGREIETPVEEDILALRRSEFDFHIIIVYTINRKSQA